MPMNPLTPGPPPVLAPTGQPYYRQGHSPPQQQHGIAHAGPTSCYNCGSASHWAQQCTEPRRNVPAGSTTPRNPRNSRVHRNGPGPIITRYGPPQSHPPPPQHYHSPPYAASPHAPSPGSYPPHSYSSGYPSQPPPPPPPPPMPHQQQPHGSHYPPPPPPPHSPYQPSYQSPVTPNYQSPVYSHPPYQQPAPPPPSAPPPLHQTSYYAPAPPPPPPPVYSQTYHTPVPPPQGPYQFYQAGGHSGKQQYGPHHAHTQSRSGHDVRHGPSHSRSSFVSDAGKTGPLIWRPAQRTQWPLEATWAESEEKQHLSGTENPKGTIAKYWNRDFSRTSWWPRWRDIKDDPAFKSVRTGGSMLCGPPIYWDVEEEDNGEDMDLESGGSEADKQEEASVPDVTDKLNGILSGATSPVVGNGRSKTRNGDYRGHQSSWSPEGSPQRGRSRSPKSDSYGSYRQRSPHGHFQNGEHTKEAPRTRNSHPLPTKPHQTLASTQDSPRKLPKANGQSEASSSIMTSKKRSRSRSASPDRRESIPELPEEAKRRHREYDDRVRRESSSDHPTWSANGNANHNKRRRSAANGGVSDLYGRRW